MLHKALKILAAAGQDEFEAYLKTTITLNPDPYEPERKLSLISVTASPPSMLKYGASSSWYTVVTVVVEVQPPRSKAFTYDITFEVSIDDRSQKPYASIHPRFPTFTINSDPYILGELLQNWVIYVT